MKWYLSHFCYCITAEPYFRTQERQLCRGRSPIGEPRVNAGGNPRRSCDPSQQADRVGSDRYAWVDVRATSPFHCLNIRQKDALLSGSSSARQRMLMHISSWMKIIIFMSVSSWKTGYWILSEIRISRIQGDPWDILFFSTASRVGSSTTKSVTQSRINWIRVKLGITRRKGLINTCQK